MSDQVEVTEVFGRYRKFVASVVGVALVGVITQDPLATALTAASAAGVLVVPNVPDVRAIRRAIEGVKDFDQGEPEDPRA